MNPVRTNVLHLEKLNLFISSTTFQKGQSIDLKFLSVFPTEDNYFYRNVVFKGSFITSYPGINNTIDLAKAGYIGPISSAEGLKIPQNLNNIMLRQKGIITAKLTADENDSIYYCVRAREDKKVVDEIYALAANESKFVQNNRFFFVFGNKYVIDGKEKTENGVYLSETKEVLVKAIDKCRIISFRAEDRKISLDNK